MIQFKRAADKIINLIYFDSIVLIRVFVCVSGLFLHFLQCERVRRENNANISDDKVQVYML